MADACVFCDRELLRSEAEVYLENEHCVYASTRDPRDPPDILPGCGVIVPIEHRGSPFDFTAEQVPENRRPDPFAPGNGRARSLGRS